MNQACSVCAIALVTLLASCTQTAEPTPPPAAAMQPALALALRVVGGTPSGPADDFALRVGGCSGALIAPRLIVTARHCVARMNPRAAATAQCHVQNAYDPISSQTPGDLLPASDLTIATGAAASPRSDVHVLHVDVDTSGDASGCWRDVAVLTLDTALALPMLPLRSAAVAPGERLRLVGYGNVDDNGTPAPGRRTRSDMEVLDVGETTFVGPDGARHVLLDDNLLTTAAACGGDSGGPLLDAAGALVGLTHRGLGDCESGLTIYSGLARLRPLLALAAARIAPPTTDAASAPLTDAGPAADAGMFSGAGRSNIGSERSACALGEEPNSGLSAVVLLLMGVVFRRDQRVS